MEKSTFFSKFLKEKKTLLEGGEVLWDSGQPSFRWHIYWHKVSEIENGQQSSENCDNVKSFYKLYQNKSAI